MNNRNRIWKIAVFVMVLAAFVITPAMPATASENPDQQVVGYFIEWGIYGRGYLVKDIVTTGSADHLTVINYAFGNVAPNADGQVVCQLGDEWADFQKPWSASQSVTGTAVTWPNPILGNFQQLKALKTLYPNIKVLISLGGWSWSKYFSDAALTPASRQAFVKSCVDLFIKGDLPDPGWGGMGGPGAAAGVFDGIDIDWEYPAAEGNTGNIYRPEDTQNFTLLLAEFRAQLNAAQPGLLLTFAAPAGKDKYSKIELNKVAASVDWINLMTYDFHGPWDTRTNFQSNLHASSKDWSQPPYSVHTVVQAYHTAGVPKRKIIIGMPFYSHGWTGVTNANGGLYQAAAGPAPATWENGTEDYKVLKAKYGQGLFQRYWDPKTRSAWLFDGSTFWTYDDETTTQVKASYARDQSLGGVMFWELSGDDGSLVHAIANGLQP